MFVYYLTQLTPIKTKKILILIGLQILVIFSKILKQRRLFCKQGGSKITVLDMQISRESENEENEGRKINEIINNKKLKDKLLGTAAEEASTGVVGLRERRALSSTTFHNIKNIAFDPGIPDNLKHTSPKC